MKIGLIGTFDVENFGDCMFPELYAKFLKDRFGDVEIALYSPIPQAAKILSFDCVHALPCHTDSAALATLDADKLILIGGETIGHGHSAGTFNFPRTTLSAYLRLWLGPIIATRNPALRPTFCAAHSVGATQMPANINRAVAQCLAAADWVRFRDQFSTDWICAENIKFRVDIDPMFLIDQVCVNDDWTRRATINLPEGIVPGHYLAAQVSLGYGSNDLHAWVQAVTTIARNWDLPVVLVPICHFLEDERLLARLETMLRSEDVNAKLVRGQLNVKDTAALIGMSFGYVGSSLHGAVTAVAFARPLAVLGHTPDGKHAGTLRAVGINDVVATRADDLPACFTHSSAMDRSATRSHAQELALASVSGLLDAIQSGTSEASSEGLNDAANFLIADENQIRWREDIKRTALRAVRKTPGLAELYHKWRQHKAFKASSR